MRRAACKCRQGRAPRPGPWAALLMADGPLPQLQKIPQCAAKRCLEPARPWGGAQHGIIWGWVCLPSRIHHAGVCAPPEKVLQACLYLYFLFFYCFWLPHNIGRCPEKMTRSCFNFHCTQLWSKSSHDRICMKLNYGWLAFVRRRRDLTHFR